MVRLWDHFGHWQKMGRRAEKGHGAEHLLLPTSVRGKGGGRHPAVLEEEAKSREPPPPDVSKKEGDETESLFSAAQSAWGHTRV